MKTRRSVFKVHAETQLKSIKDARVLVYVRRNSHVILANAKQKLGKGIFLSKHVVSGLNLLPELCF